MAGISFGGIASGLDTQSIVDQLMSLEANPQRLLQQKLTKQNAVVSALQSVNTRVASLLSSASAMAKPDAWERAAATSSSPTVTVGSTTGTGAGTLTFDVTRLAQRSSATTAPITDGSTTGPQTLTVTRAAGGDPITVTAASGDAADLADALNAAGAGVTATSVRTDDGTFRLLVSAAESGAGGGFTITGDIPPLTELAVGQDAEIDLGAGVLITSASNTFDGLLGGVAVTVSKVEQGVTVTSAPDGASVAKQAAGMVGALNVVLSEIADRTKAVVGGSAPLVGNSLMRGLQQQLASAVSTAVPGASLSDLGIRLTREGTVTVDEQAFAAYAAKEPARAEALTTAFATVLSDVAKNASSSTGTISQAITSTQGTTRDLTSRIEDWTDRLALRRANLDRQFAALEVALQRSQAAGAQLVGALGALGSNTR